MKLLLLFLLVSTACSAQKKTYSYLDTPVRIDSVTGGMIYTEVVRVDSATADQLYSRAKTFLLKAFTSEGAVIQLDDKAAGLVGGKGKLLMNMTTGQMLLTGTTQMYYEMAVEIRVKDGRYRYEFSNIEVVNRGYRVRVDDSIRKNPAAAKRTLERDFSEKEYNKYMGDKNPINIVIRQLKQTMASSGNKNDF